ncbi:MAG: ATP-binding cassette domain-containing protein [Burkholderiales bacterium]
MALITLLEASLAYGHVPLLDHTDLVIEPGERIALVGRNGAGKSSLLSIIAGRVNLDSGRTLRVSDLTIASVAQEPELDPLLSIADTVTAALGPHDDDDWSRTSRVDRILTKLGLNGEAIVGTLSGGQRKRVALAQALVTDPKLLLLDEPTNHLDIDAIMWLEEVVLGFSGAVLLVTHDRRFLDRVATRVIELDRGILRSYPGNFTAYQRRKAEELSAEASASARFDKLLAQEEVWIRKGVEARRTRNEGRVRRLEQLRRERAARRERSGNVRLTVDEGERSGRLVVELENVTKAFGSKRIVRDFSMRIMRGDRIGLIGPNGVGKTTLLKLILGQLQPDAGDVRLGSKLQIAYFDQMREALDESRTLADTISPGSDWVEIGTERRHVMTYLGDFLFSPARANSPVRTLSGGERNRLLLARLFAKSANALVLDEPTNDLDFETLELLEALLQDYAGTVFLVSHDRAFLDAVVTQTIAPEGEGVWREYAGGYDDYLVARDRSKVASVSGAKPAAPATATVAAPPPTKPRAKLSYKEQRELAELPARMERLEAEQKALTAQLADPAFYQSEPAKVRAANDRVTAIENQLVTYLERWEALEARGAG